MGILSIVPPLVAIILAIVTRRVIISLFISIWVGGIIYTSGDPFTGLAYTFTWMKDVMVDDWNARFLVMTALLGVGAAFMYKTGGSNGLIRILESKLTTKRRVLFRSEEHTSELQSRGHLVCRLLLEKKKKQVNIH